MKVFRLLFLLISTSSIPQRPRFTSGQVRTLISADQYVEEVLSGPITNESELADHTSPSAAAALAYMQSISKDGLCGLPTEVYLKTILSGRSQTEANAAATRVYIEAYNNGERLPKGGACAAADAAFREAWRVGEDPVLESALAFMKAWPGGTDGNPCAAAGMAYIMAIIAGQSHLEANTVAMTSFANAFKDLAKLGKPLKDPTCLAAATSYIRAVPQKADPANSAAFTAFKNKIFEENAPAFDPVCLAALGGFIDAYNSGDDLLTANLKSAKSFFDAFKRGSSFPADSPCAAATLAYADEIQKRLNLPNINAMVAYITKAIRGGTRKYDPVCAAAIEAYFDAYIETESEEEANEAAAIAYLNTLDLESDFDLESPCAAAAKAYIEEFSK